MKIEDINIKYKSGLVSKIWFAVGIVLGALNIIYKDNKFIIEFLLCYIIALLLRDIKIDIKFKNEN